MRHTFFAIPLSLAGLCLLPAMAAADTLTLRNGQVVQGAYLGGSAREIRMDLGDHVQSFPLDQISALQFDSGPLPTQGYNPPPQPQGYNNPQSTAGNNSANSAPAVGYNPGGDNPAPNNPGPMGITLPSGTVITVRMIDAVDSDSSSLGRTYRASVDEPVLVNGQPLIPRGAAVLTKVVQDQQSGKIEGRTVVALALQSVVINGQPVDLSSQQVSEASSSRGSRSAKVIGGSAVLGTLLGAVAGGGRGAAIGAASGAAVGTGAEVLTHGQRVRIPSESRLSFTLSNPVSL